MSFLIWQNPDANSVASLNCLFSDDVFFFTYLIFQIADVAQAIVNAIHEDDSIGQTFELVG